MLPHRGAPRPTPPRHPAFQGQTKKPVPASRLPAKRTRHNWTQQERDFIRLYYRGTNESRRYIANVLKVTEYAVAGQVARMGLCKRTDRTKWTPDEDEQLRTLLPKYPVSKVAKIMHRSVNAVYIRAKRLQMSCRDRDDWYTLQEVAEILGMDKRWVKKRIDIGALKAGANYEHKRTDGYTTTYRIRRGDLKNFIRRYPDELNAVNVDLIAVVDLLSGLLPI